MKPNQILKLGKHTIQLNWNKGEFVLLATTPLPPEEARETIATIACYLQCEGFFDDLSVAS
jgi:hypothetical protein